MLRLTRVFREFVLKADSNMQIQYLFVFRVEQRIFNSSIPSFAAFGVNEKPNQWRYFILKYNRNRDLQAVSSLSEKNNMSRVAIKINDVRFNLVCAFQRFMPYPRRSSILINAFSVFFWHSCTDIIKSYAFSACHIEKNSVVAVDVLPSGAEKRKTELIS